MWSVFDIVMANYAAGEHWYSRGAEDCWESSVVDEVFEGPGGVFLISRDTQCMAEPKRCTLHKFDPDTGHIERQSGFMEYQHLETARAAALQLAGGSA